MQASVITSPSNRVTETTSWLMLPAAALFDTAQIVVAFSGILQHFVALLSFLTFWFWFMLLGVSFSKIDRAVTFFGITMAEMMLPLVNLLPMLSVAVFLTIRSAQKENRIRSGI